MNNYLNKLIVLLSILFLSSCTTKTLDDLEVAQDNNANELVTFQDVKITFETICQVCHSNPTQNGAPMPLVTYLNVMEAVQNRGLLDRISRNEGEEGLMPNGGPRLPQQTIDKIFQWNEDGLLEN